MNRAMNHPDPNRLLAVGCAGVTLFKCDKLDRIAEVDWRLIPSKEWENSPQSRDPSWAAVLTQFGLVLAHKHLI